MSVCPSNRRPSIRITAANARRSHRPYEKMRREKGGKGTKTIDASLRTVRNNLGAHLKLPAKQFCKADLRALRDDIHKRAPQQASPLPGYSGRSCDGCRRKIIIDTTSWRMSSRSPASTTRADANNDEIPRCGAPRSSRHRRSAKHFGGLVRFLLVTGSGVAKPQR